MIKTQTISEHVTLFVEEQLVSVAGEDSVAVLVASAW